MKASELVGKLVALMTQHGDLEVFTFPTGKLAEPTVKVETLSWHLDSVMAGQEKKQVITLS